MKKDIYVIFTAGGSGTRMGSSTPKQFIEFQGIPILQMTIGNVVAAIPEAKVVTVLPPKWIQEWKELCLKNSFEYPQIVVEGGITRFHSVKNAMAHIPDNAIVLIHDGVRPFVSAGLLHRILEKMNCFRAVVPVTPVTDTLKLLERESDGDMVSLGPAPDRSMVFGAQTPQAFLSEDIKEAYTQAYDVSFTDDASVAQKKGLEVRYIKGDRFNIKITTPEDLPLAEFIFQKQLWRAF